MTAAFEFVGPEPVPYAFGVAKPGDVARFTACPDANWQPVAEPGAPELRRPNKAASKEDWQSYAAAEGSFTASTGTLPEEATRAAIIDHYTAGDTPEPATEPAADAPMNAGADEQGATQ